MMRNFRLERIKVIINYIILGLIIIMSGIMVEASHNKVVNSKTLEGIEGTHFNYVHRTAFHFQPPRYWINDPNGPMIYKGLYHLFYQYNPHGSDWGDIEWAHSVSPDLINWKALKPAIYMSRPFDINGAWSGSATILPNNRPVILYTGLDSENRQVQNIAFPANVSDPYLEEWIKPDYNPIIYPSSDMNATKFRDPTTAWHSNGHWKMVVGGVRKNRGMAYLYRSRDFKKWAKAQHPLHSAQNGGMWECPDFYPVLVDGEFGLDTSMLGVNVKHVLKISLDGTWYDYYTIGRYDSYRDKYIPDHNLVDGWNGLRYDYGNFYASKTFFDSKMRRRILWGWSNESTSIFQNVVKGWAGIQAIPRSVWLDKNGKQLLTWPVEEVKALRSRSVQLRHYNLKTGKSLEIKGITTAQADVEVEFSLQNLDKAELFDPKWTNAQDLCGKKGPTVQGGVGPFGLLTLASKNLEEYTPITFRVFKAHDRHVILMCSDATRSSVNYIDYKPSFGAFVDADLTDRKFSLRSLIDHSVIESFGFGGKACITSRVYPTIAIMNNAHLYVFNNGSETVTLKKLNAWSMKRPLEMNN